VEIDSIFCSRYLQPCAGLSQNQELNKEADQPSQRLKTAGTSVCPETDVHSERIFQMSHHIFINNFSDFIHVSLHLTVLPTDNDKIPSGLVWFL